MAIISVLRGITTPRGNGRAVSSYRRVLTGHFGALLVRA